jgi:hypothetical protein
LLVVVVQEIQVAHHQKMVGVEAVLVDTEHQLELAEAAVQQNLL